MDTHERDAQLQLTRRRAGPALAVAMLASSGLAAGLTVLGDDWRVAAFLIAFFAPLLWLIRQGHAWPRWLLVALCAAVDRSNVVSTVRLKLSLRH